MKKQTKIAIFTSALTAVSGTVISMLYKTADYFFNYALVRANTLYKDSQKPFDDLSEREKAERKFAENRKRWFTRRHIRHLKTTSDDGLLLHASYLPAKKKTKDFILAIHGYRCNGIDEYAVFTPFYHREGYNILLPDDRAHGLSEGDYIGFGCLDRKDCLRWCNYIIENYGEDCRIFLHGISMGAATVMSASGDEALPPQVKGIIADCGFSRGWDEFAHVLKSSFHLPAFPLLNLFDLICKKRAGYSTKDFSPIEEVAHAKVPILFIHGGSDDFVPTAMVYALYNACTSKKMLWVAPKAAHARSYYVNPSKYEALVRTFIARTLK